jgi:hypothetical protein
MDDAVSIAIAIAAKAYKAWCADSNTENPWAVIGFIVLLVTPKARLGSRHKAYLVSLRVALPAAQLDSGHAPPFQKAADYYRKVIGLILARPDDYDEGFDEVFFKLVEKLDPTAR